MSYIFDYILIPRVQSSNLSSCGVDNVLHVIFNEQCKVYSKEVPFIYIF